MLYKFSVCFENEQDKNDMRDFLLDNTSVFERMAILDQRERIEPETFTISEDPNRPHALCFMRRQMSQYFLSACAWMATKSTVRNYREQPFFYYGEDTIDVQISNKAVGAIKVDSQGVVLYERKKGLLALLYAHQEEIHEQLLGLQVLWEVRSLEKQIIPVEGKNRGSYKI